ncbi:TPA: hypothetical protein ACHTW7_004495 [Escherichia coli]
MQIKDYEEGYNMKAIQNLLNAGNVFMFTTWIQSQMADLVILNKNKHLISSFISSPKRIPDDYHKIRVQYWEKQFGEIKSEFCREFSDILTKSDLDYIDKVYYIRNMLAHAHVSIARDYMLYRPSGGDKKEEKLLSALEINKPKESSSPIVIKIDLENAAIFERTSDYISHVDQKVLEKVSKHIGIPHGRIR